MGIAAISVEARRLPPAVLWERMTKPVQGLEVLPTDTGQNGTGTSDKVDVGGIDNGLRLEDVTGGRAHAWRPEMTCRSFGGGSK